MLSLQSQPYIEASVPVLREHGLSITRTFYQSLFAEHPELTQIFNMGNQANGSQQQSLASAVFAYAANFADAEALAPVISRIVHKHVSVGIRAEHYPIVGRHLLGAIQTTLGAAATPALLEAWSEAYGLLAEALIAAEKRLYAARNTQPGALRSFRVTRIERESELVSTYCLAPVDQHPNWDFQPGQYVSVLAEWPDGTRQLRQYSLSDAPGLPELRISVKREPASVQLPAGQVSNWIHETVAVGSLLQLSPPSGDFLPDTFGSEPIVLLSAGIGITPMIAALNQMALVNPGRTVIFGHATRHPLSYAHRRDVDAALARMPELAVRTFYEQPDASTGERDALSGQMDVSQLPPWPYADSKVYLCGPLGFMQAQWLQLLEAGVPVTKLYREVFGPDMLDHLL
ncbi:MAG: globin domain-containing protein [Candidatus Sericytochromatia bacterium]